MYRRKFLHAIGGTSILAMTACSETRSGPVVGGATDEEDFGSFNFGLSEAEEKRAAQLHADSIIVDLMCQGPISYRSLPDEMFADALSAWRENPDPSAFSNALGSVNALAATGKFPGYMGIWRATGMTAANFQIGGDVRDGAHLLAKKVVNAYEGYELALTAQSIRAAHQQGNVSRYLNYQTFPASVADLDWFDEAYAAGVRMGGLTYNTATQFGVGCKEEDTGLTPFGVEAIGRMNDVGMLVDVAHAGPATTIGACKASRVPIVASHAGAENVFMNDRNKSDDELKALRDTGGVCGVVTVPPFLTTSPPGDIELTLDHVDYIANLIGVDHVAIGTDWPLALPKWMLAKDGPMEMWLRARKIPDEDLGHLDKNLEGFDDYRDMPNFTRGLVKRGYTDEEIIKIIGGNALRVFEAVWR